MCACRSTVIGSKTVYSLLLVSLRNFIYRYFCGWIALYRQFVRKLKASIGQTVQKINLGRKKMSGKAVL